MATPYMTSCPSCGYEHNNGPSNWTNLEAGNYCPECGRQFTAADEETKREYFERRGLWGSNQHVVEDAPEDVDVDPEEPQWQFECRKCDAKAGVATLATARAAANEHEESTGHFSFRLLFGDEGISWV